MLFNEPVDISKSILVCNVFHFLFSAAKASMYPFLTLYLRQLGFTGIQTGIIMGAKTLMAFVTAPIWSRCSVKNYKRRLILIFSTVMLSATYLTITIVPTKFHVINSCGTPQENFTVTPSVDPVTSNIAVTSVYTPKPEPFTPFSKENLTTHGITNVTQSTTAATQAPITTLSSTTPNLTLSLSSEFISELEHLGQENNLSLSELSKIPIKELKTMVENSNLTNKYALFLINRSDTDLGIIMDSLKTELDNPDKTRQKRDSAINKTWKVMKDKVRAAAKSLTELGHELFYVIFGIFIVGEILASPVEKIADDAWYDFLDEIDYLDNYGKQRLWSAVAYVIFPIVAALLVDHTPCSLGFNVNHMAIHFYMFAGLLGLTLIVALFYPMPSSNKRKYVSKLFHGCSILFCKCRNVTYVLSLLVMGVCFSTTNYLFWVVADLGGPELPMGVAVAVAAFSELPMLLLSESLVKRFSHAGMVSVAMVALAVRLLYYSFLWVNWAVVPIELLYALSHTCMWWAVLSNPDFSFSNSVERSVRSILSSVYFGIGYGFGSLASGVVYDYFGSEVLFRGSAVLAVAWSAVFFCMQKAIPKDSRIKYSKLLQGDDDDELSDGSTHNLEADWLQQALRER